MLRACPRAAGAGKPLQGSVVARLRGGLPPPPSTGPAAAARCGRAPQRAECAVLVLPWRATLMGLDARLRIWAAPRIPKQLPCRPHTSCSTCCCCRQPVPKSPILLPAGLQAPVRAALRFPTTQAAASQCGQQHLRVASVRGRSSRSPTRGARGAGTEPRSLAGAQGASASGVVGTTALNYALG